MNSVNCLRHEHYSTQTQYQEEKYYVSRPSKKEMWAVLDTPDWLLGEKTKVLQRMPLSPLKWFTACKLLPSPDAVNSIQCIVTSLAQSIHSVAQPPLCSSCMSKRMNAADTHGFLRSVPRISCITYNMQHRQMGLQSVSTVCDRRFVRHLRWARLDWASVQPRRSAEADRLSGTLTLLTVYHTLASSHRS